MNYNIVKYIPEAEVTEDNVKEQIATRWYIIYNVLMGSLYKDILYSEIHRLSIKKFEEGDSNE